MTHDTLLKAVYTKLSTISPLPTILYPNVNYSTVPNEYLSVYVIPAPTNSVTIDNCEYQYGIIQVDCVTLDGQGEIKAAEIAEKIITAFKIGTVITTGLTVHRPSYASAGLSGNGRYKIPVTIRYQSYSLI